MAPKAEALAQLVEKTSPAAVLLPSGGEGKEIAGRLAVKTGSGLITDAVDVQAGDGAPVTTQSVFAGSFTVQAKVTKGTPIITVKPNSATPEQADGAGAAEELRRDHLRRCARAPGSPSPSRARPPGRPELTEAAIVVSGGRGTGGDFSAGRGLRRLASARPSAPRAPPSTPAGCRTPSRSARPARPSRRSSTSPTASPARSSTGPACRPRRRSSRSTRTRRRRSSSSSTSVSSATCTSVLPGRHRGDHQAQGLSSAPQPAGAVRQRHRLELGADTELGEHAAHLAADRRLGDEPARRRSHPPTCRRSARSGPAPPSG